MWSQGFHASHRPGWLWQCQPPVTPTTPMAHPMSTRCSGRFWKTTPSQGKFKGQRCYGYISIEEFINAVSAIRRGEAVASDYDHNLATLHTTICVTAILEAGRRSLDSSNLPFGFIYADESSCEPMEIRPLCSSV